MMGSFPAQFSDVGARDAFELSAQFFFSFSVVVYSESLQTSFSHTATSAFPTYVICLAALSSFVYWLLLMSEQNKKLSVCVYPCIFSKLRLQQELYLWAGHILFSVEKLTFLDHSKAKILIYYKYRLYVCLYSPLHQNDLV